MGNLISLNYTNYEYGYSLRIPWGIGWPQPLYLWPQDGIKIKLSQDDEARILANADFSAAGYPSLDAAVDSDSQWLRRNSKEVQVVNRHRESLGHLEAARLSVRYKDPTLGVIVINETITAIRRAKHPEEGVLYTLYP